MTDPDYQELARATNAAWLAWLKNSTVELYAEYRRLEQELSNARHARAVEREAAK